MPPLQNCTCSARPPKPVQKQSVCRVPWVGIFPSNSWEEGPRKNKWSFSVSDCKVGKAKVEKLSEKWSQWFASKVNNSQGRLVVVGPSSKVNTALEVNKT